MNYAISSLDEVLGYLEIQLSDSALGFQLLDPLTHPLSSTNCFADQGAGVNWIRTTNTELYRGKDYVRYEDEIRILVSWRIKPKDQRASRNEAIRAIRHMTKAITQLTTERKWHPTPLTETPTVHPSGEWYLIDTRWTFVRDAQVGTG